MLQMQIKDDPNRITLMQTSFTAAQAILGNKPSDQNQGGGPPGGPGFRGAPGLPPPGQGGFGGGGFGGGRFGGQGFGGGGFKSPPPAGGGGPNGDPQAFFDRLTHEDRRDDWEMKVQLVVIIDPPAVAAASSGMQPGPQAP
jgi:hypothetical protein